MTDGNYELDQYWYDECFISVFVSGIDFSWNDDTSKWGVKKSRRSSEVYFIFLNLDLLTIWINFKG